MKDPWTPLDGAVLGWLKLSLWGGQAARINLSLWPNRAAYNEPPHQAREFGYEVRNRADA